MSKKLLITEKPSVAMEFAKALKINSKKQDGYIESEEYIITWCVGHLVNMSYPEKYNPSLKYWSLSTLPFVPKIYKYEVIDSVSKQYEIVEKLLKKDEVSIIYVCTDSGREGEYIYRLVDKMADVIGKSKRRVWIDSQTEEAILNGITNAKDLSEYDNLAAAAYLRAKEDYLIGINFSRMLSVVHAKSLANLSDEKSTVISVGRVMTCVLGMIVDKEIQIREFKKVKFYKIVATFEDDLKTNFDGEWKSTEKSSVFESPKLYNETGFLKKESAEEFIKVVEENKDVPKVSSVAQKKSKDNPPLLFNLAELQNECSKIFKISPDETLNIAQALYEKKLVTYPRTDARVLSSAIAKEISKNLNGLARNIQEEAIKNCIDIMVKEKYKTNLTKTKYVNDSKITDHYAIIPTGQGFENYNKLNNLQKDVFNIIVRRFLCIFFPPAEYSKVSVIIDIGNESFFTSGKVCLKKGYLEVLNVNNKTNDDKNDNVEFLKTLKKNQELTLINLGIKEGETSPPTRYNSGSIILAMENAGKLIEDDNLREQIKGCGIGTSATRADIIKKLIRIGYINLNDKTQILTPNTKGEGVYNIVKGSIPDMLNAELTASWEKGLSMVSSGSITEEEFMNKLESYICSKVNRFKNKLC